MIIIFLVMVLELMGEKVIFVKQGKMLKVAELVLIHLLEKFS